MTVSEIGTYIFDFAVSWVILERTSSALMMTIYLALGMIGKIVLGPINPRFSFLFKEAVPEDYLHKGNAVRSIVNNCDSLGGIVLGGVLIRFLPFNVVLAINAVSYFISAISEIFISYKYKSQKEVSNIKFKTEFIEGIQSFL